MSHATWPLASLYKFGYRVDRIPVMLREYSMQNKQFGKQFRPIATVIRKLLLSSKVRKSILRKQVFHQTLNVRYKARLE